MNIYKHASEETLKDYIKEIEEWVIEVHSEIKEKIYEALEEKQAPK